MDGLTDDELRRQALEGKRFGRLRPTTTPPHLAGDPVARAALVAGYAALIPTLKERWSHDRQERQDPGPRVN